MGKLIFIFLFISSYCTAGVPLWKQEDKQEHLLAGALISQTTYIYTLKITDSKNQAFIWSLVTPLLLGTLKEVYDSYQPNKKFDIQDLGVTMLGATIVIPLDLFSTKKTKKQVHLSE